MPGRSYVAGSGYRYGFNGKENDNEVKGEGNQQDYGMRVYDPRLGRFLSSDPLSKSYPALTPYQFGNNKPINGIDLDGMEWVLKIHDPKMLSDFITAYDNKDIYKQREISFRAVNSVESLEAFFESANNNPKYFGQIVDAGDGSYTNLKGGELIYDENTAKGVTMNYTYLGEDGSPITRSLQWDKRDDVDRNHDIFYPVDVRAFNSPEFSNFYSDGTTTQDVVLKYINYYGAGTSKSVPVGIAAGTSTLFGYMRGYGYVSYDAQLFGVGTIGVGKEMGMMTGTINWPDVTGIKPSMLEGYGSATGWGAGNLASGKWYSYSNLGDMLKLNTSKNTVSGSFNGLSGSLFSKKFSGSVLYSQTTLNSYKIDQNGNLSVQVHSGRISIGF